MEIKLKYPIRKGISGFRTCISYYVLTARLLVDEHERDKELYDEFKMDDYIVSLKLLEIYKKFEDKLTEDQNASLHYFLYHNPNEEEPVGYETNIKCVYQKWLHTFFDERNRPTTLKRISYQFLGRVMKRIRNKSNLTKVEVCDILGIIPKTIDRYESGKSVPSLDYIVSFCCLFSISIDELVEHAIL